MIECYPTQFEAHDTVTNDALFKVKTFDECCAEVTISTVVNVELWDEIAPMIRQCLVAMKLENDDAS